jgi:hypothetical protein
VPEVTDEGAARDWVALPTGATTEPQAPLRVDAMLADAEGRDEGASNAWQRACAVAMVEVDRSGAKWGGDQLARNESQLAWADRSTRWDRTAETRAASGS